MPNKQPGHQNKLHVISCKAYSLVEISVSLLIISFIVASIFTGKSLINNAKFRTVIKEAQTIIGATMSFKDMYGGLPGDIDNAKTIFGATDKNNYAITNGNADSLLNGSPGTAINGGYYYDQEKVSAFQQLALIGLIKGVYNGNNSSIAIGQNLPPSVYKQFAGYTYYSGSMPQQSLRGNSVMLVAYNGIIQRLITAGEAFYIDSKIDDGLPFVGKVMVLTDTSGCANGNHYNGSHPLSQYNYVLSNPDKLCNGELYFAFPDYIFQP